MISGNLYVARRGDLPVEVLECPLGENHELRPVRCFFVCPHLADVTAGTQVVLPVGRGPRLNSKDLRLDNLGIITRSIRQD